MEGAHVSRDPAEAGKRRDESRRNLSWCPIGGCCGVMRMGGG